MQYEGLSNSKNNIVSIFQAYETVLTFYRFFLVRFLGLAEFPKQHFVHGMVVSRISSFGQPMSL